MGQFCSVFTYDEYTNYQEFYLELTPESKEMDKDRLIRILVENIRYHNNPEFDIYEYENQLRTRTLEELLVPPIYPVVTTSIIPEHPFRYNITAVDYAVDVENNRVTKSETWTAKSPELIEEDYTWEIKSRTDRINYEANGRVQERLKFKLTSGQDIEINCTPPLNTQYEHILTTIDPDKTDSVSIHVYENVWDDLIISVPAQDAFKIATAVKERRVQIEERKALLLKMLAVSDIDDVYFIHWDMDETIWPGNNKLTA